MTIIDYRHFQGCDLTSLLAFDALMRERNVTRAATRLRLGQPAVSHILAKLRNRYSDALFVRTGRGLEPTTRALQMYPAILEALNRIQTTFDGRSTSEFAERERIFRIGLPDLVETMLMPDLLSRARSEASRIQFRTVAAPRVVAPEMLDNRLIDLAINYLPETLTWHHRALLFEDDYVCVMRRHRRVPRRITLEDFLMSDHIVAELRDGQTDRVSDTLDRQQLRRRVVFKTTNYFMMAMMLSRCDAIGTIPRRLGARLIAQFSLVPLELPLRVPSFPLSMLWHHRDHDDPALIWLRKLIVEIMKPRKA